MKFQADFFALLSENSMEWEGRKKPVVGCSSLLWGFRFNT